MSTRRTLALIAVAAVGNGLIAYGVVQVAGSQLADDAAGEADRAVRSALVENCQTARASRRYTMKVLRARGKAVAHNPDESPVTQRSFKPDNARLKRHIIASDPAGCTEAYQP